MDYQKAKANPSANFASPADVVKADNLTRDQKLSILRQWEYDAREMEVAEDENMAGGKADQLGRVLKAIDSLKGGKVKPVESAHKQGGQ